MPAFQNRPSSEDNQLREDMPDIAVQEQGPIQDTIATGWRIRCGIHAGSNLDAWILSLDDKSIFGKDPFAPNPGMIPGQNLAAMID